MTFEEFMRQVAEATGDQGLAGERDRLLADRDSLLALVGEKSGADRVEKELTRDERSLEKRLRARQAERATNLELLDALGKAAAAERTLNYIRLRQSSQRLDEIFEKAGVGPAADDAPPESPTSADRGVRAFAQVLATVHTEYMASLRALERQLRWPLAGYRVRKWLWFLAPRAVSLVASFAIFAVGAGTAAELLPEFWLKILFVVLVWGVEQFVFEPLADRLADRYRRRKLTEAVTWYYRLKVWALFMEPFFDHQLEQEIQKHKARQQKADKGQG